MSEPLSDEQLAEWRAVTEKSKSIRVARSILLSLIDEVEARRADAKTALAFGLENAELKHRIESLHNEVEAGQTRADENNRIIASLRFNLKDLVSEKGQRLADIGRRDAEINSLRTQHREAQGEVERLSIGYLDENNAHMEAVAELTALRDKNEQLRIATVPAASLNEAQAKQTAMRLVSHTLCGHEPDCADSDAHHTSDLIDSIAAEILRTAPTTNQDPIAHLCETGRYRPYPRTLCSSCKTSSKSVDIEGGDSSARGLCTALNQTIPANGAAEICAEMAREAAMRAAKCRASYHDEDGGVFASGAAAQLSAQCQALREAERRIRATANDSQKAPTNEKD